MAPVGEQPWDEPPAGAVHTGQWVGVAVLLGVIVLLTALGNSLLILLIFSQRSLRNTSNYFLVSLFMSDLMVGLVVMPPAMLNELYGRWALDAAFCRVWLSFDVMCCSASILNLCVISLDRYLLIISPLRYKLRMTPARALALVLATWTLAALASFLPIEMGWHEQELEARRAGNVTSGAAPGAEQCRLTVSLPYALIASGLTFFLPSAAICFTYCRILLAARKQAIQVASLTTNMPNPAEEPVQVLVLPVPESRRLVTKHSRKALKASLTLGVLLGMFFVAWLPFFIANVVQAVCDCVPSGFFDVLTWLGYCNSTMNPIIYPLFMRDFKRAMGKYLPCCHRRTRVISLNSAAPPRLGLSLRNVLTLRGGDTDSTYSATLGNEHLLQHHYKDHSTDPLPVTAASESVNLFDPDQEMQLHPLNAPTD
ncbi:5-hydroxytryptamine receptor 6 [Gastrophryne carolinensis]